MTKEDKYVAALREIEIRLERGGNLIADLGNTAAVLKNRLGFFWVGFYFFKENHLVLGPFQGMPACAFLSLEKGVCAACVKKQETILVNNVEEFSGHVACDPNSKSEIVVPLFDGSGSLKGVLDVDSDVANVFDDVDKVYLEKVAKLIQGCWQEE